jgi:hypothetical protein
MKWSRNFMRSLTGLSDFSLFNICSSSKNCPYVRCTSVANVVCMGTDIFGTKIVFLHHILQHYFQIIKTLIVINMNVSVCVCFLLDNGWCDCTYCIFYYCLNNAICLALSFVCVHVFVLFPLFAFAYFIIGCLAVE